MEILTKDYNTTTKCVEELGIEPSSFTDTDRTSAINRKHPADCNRMQ